MDPGGLEGGGRELLGERKRSARSSPRFLLSLRRGREAKEERAPQLVVVALVGLDDVLVERGGGLVPRPLAELDELAVLHDGDGLPGELARGHALHGGPEGGQVLKQRAVTLGQRV